MNPDDKPAIISQFKWEENEEAILMAAARLDRIETEYYDRIRKLESTVEEQGYKIVELEHTVCNLENDIRYR
jgi:predicted RNase H-like nuclease (RuvC/YqgF family)